METAATGLTFRDAGDGDVDVLVALIESAYRGDSSRVGWTTEADILEGQRTDPEGVLAVIKSPDNAAARHRAGRRGRRLLPARTPR